MEHSFGIINVDGGDTLFDRVKNVSTGESSHTSPQFETNDDIANQYNSLVKAVIGLFKPFSPRF